MERIGVSFGRNYHIGPDEYAKLAQEAESLGFTAVSVPEAWGRDAMVMLAQLAVRTTTIELLTGIVTVYGRTPAMLAQAAATVDELSKGRMVLGLGVSGPKVIEGWHGMPWERPLRRTREYVDIIRTVVSGQRVNYDGHFFHLRDFKLQFTPYRDRIPIHLGAYGPKNLQLTGEIADGWVGGEASVENLPDFLAHVEEGARRAGRSMADLTITMSVGLCYGTDEKVVRRLTQESLAYRIGGLGPFHYGAIARQGFEKECQTIKRLWGQFKRDEAAEQVTDEMLEQFSCAGGPEQGRQRIQELRRLGVDLPIVGFPKGVTPEIIRTTLKRLAS
ncbi:MAG: LLM class flavin-dependent oxidoreductase [Dehalococcoidia bacterium]